MRTPRFQIAWSSGAGRLLAIEPREDEVAAHAAELLAGYNDPQNALLLGHAEPLTEAEVIDHYAGLAEDDENAFLLYLDGKLVGDADLRGANGSAAEFAFLIAARTAQGKGLGTRFAVMIHAFGFAQLGLATIYASIAPGNVASRRVFEKLGYEIDASPAAREFADEPDDVTMGIARATFEQLHAAALEEIRIAER